MIGFGNPLKTRSVGVTQIKEFSITAATNAGLITIATIIDQPCLIKSIVLHSNGATTANFNDGAIKGGINQVIEFISAALAVWTSLNAADKQLWWEGAVRLAVGKLIEIDLQGGGSTSVDFTIIIEYEACVNGGYLA